MRYVCWKDHVDLTAEVDAELHSAAQGRVVVMGVKFEEFARLREILEDQDSIRQTIVVTCPACGSKNVFAVLESRQS